jgi:hypothetical protein
LRSAQLVIAVVRSALTPPSAATDPENTRPVGHKS